MEQAGNYKEFLKTKMFSNNFKSSASSFISDAKNDAKNVKKSGSSKKKAKNISL